MGLVFHVLEVHPVFSLPGCIQPACLAEGHLKVQLKVSVISSYPFSIIVLGKTPAQLGQLSALLSCQNDW